MKTPVSPFAALFLLLALFLIHPRLNAQQSEIDSLKRQLVQSLPDTNRVLMLNRLGLLYYITKPDTTYRLGQQAHQLASQLGYARGQSRGMNIMAVGLTTMGDYPKALRLTRQAIHISQQINDQYAISSLMNNMAVIYSVQKNHVQSLRTFQEAFRIYQTTRPPGASRQTLPYATIMLNIGESYLNVNQLDSATAYLRQAYELSKAMDYQQLLGNVLYDIGDVELKRNNPQGAMGYYRQAVVTNRQSNSLTPLAETYLRMARLFQKRNQIDSCQAMARNALKVSQSSTFLTGILEASQLLSQLYEGKNDRQALQYYKVAVAAKDSLFSQEKTKQLLTLAFEEQQHQQDLKMAQEVSWNRIRTYGLLGIVIVGLAVVLLLWRTTRRQQRSNRLLSTQKQEIDLQRSKVEVAYHALQTTQAQLLQKEKMASLGELTAGIAHEIQNPLNFVNNFAEVSTELVDELTQGPCQQLPDSEKEYAAELLADLTQNLQKITHHGSRASSIVKGMLDHARSSSGQVQPTDLNALAEEHLRLAYQGIKATDKDFTSERITHFDPTLDDVPVMPQEIGRVLLNLFSNAFYAVRERQKQGQADYQPTVRVHTLKTPGGIQIRVSDNGTGISERIQPKIFQPFFTTKPTGQGTGLGLSLSYDIITKGHGGSLLVESQEGEGSEFTIELPSNNANVLV